MLWLLLMLPSPEPKTYEVDVAELNHVLTHYGDEWHYTSYWLYWEWKFHHQHGWDWYIKDWRSANDVPYPLGNVQEWYDGRINQQIRVKFKIFKESMTLYDKEVKNRDLLPEHQRRKFGLPTPSTPESSTDGP